MGHLFSKFLRPPRRRPLSGRSRPLVTPACDTAHAGRDHPAAPAPAACSGRRPFQRARRPAASPLPQAAGPPLGLLPAVSWRSPPGGRALPARSSLVLRPSRTARIPPPVRKVALLHSLPAQVARAASQVPCPPLPASIPQGMEEEVPEHPAGQREAPAEAKGPDGGSGRPHSRGDTQGTCERPETSGVLSLHRASPAPLDRRLSPSGESSWHSTQMSPVSSSEGRAATSSCGPAGDGLGKADRDAAVLPGPRPCCPLPQETSAEEAATENHQPVQSVRDASRKDPQAEEPSGVSPRSRGPPAPASSGRNKRKLGMPLCLPLPPPLPLLWDRGDVPPPPKLPCVAVDKDLGTVQNTERPRNRTLKGRTKTLADCRAAQPAPACPPLAWDTAGSAPLAAPAAQVPVPPTAAAEPSAGPPILSVPPSSPTQQGGPETGHGGPKSPPLAVPADSLPPLTSSPTGETPPRGGPLPPGSAAAPASDRPPPPNTSTPLHPASCTKESPAPMCPTSSTIAAKSSTLTPKPISNPGVVDMDTTPPSRAVIFSTSPHCRMSCPPFSRGRGSTTQRCPAKVAASTSPPTSVAPGPTPLLHQLFGLQVTPQPTHGTLAGRQQTAFLPSAPIATGLPNLSSGATTTPVGSTSANLNAHSDPDAMDTTSPSRAVVFHSHPGSRKNHLSFYKALPGSGNTPPTSSTALGHGSTNLPQKNGLSAHIGGHSGQQPNNSYLLGKTVAPTQAVGLAPPITHPPGGSTMQAAFGGSPFGTTVNKQTAFGNQPGILHTPHSTTTGFGGPTGNTSTSLTATMTGTQSFVWSVVPSGPPLTASTIGPQTFVWSVVPSGPPLTVNTTGPQTFVWSAVPATTTGPETFVWSIVPSGPPLTVNITGPQTFVGPAVPATTTCPQTFVGPAVPATTTCPQTFVGPTVPATTTGPQTFVGPTVPATTTCPQTFVGPAVPATTTCPQTFVGPTVPATTTGPQTFVGPTVPATTTCPQTFVGPTVLATNSCPQTFVGPTVPATTTCPQTFVGPAVPATTTGQQTFVGPTVPATTTCPQTFVGPTVPATTTCPQTFVGPTVSSGPPLTVNTTGTQTFVGPTVPATTTCPQTFVGPAVPATTTGQQTFVGPTVPATTTCPQTFVGPTVPSGPPLMVNTTGPQTFVGPAVPATTTCPQTFVGPAVPATTTGPQTFVGPTVPATTTGQQTFVGPTVLHHSCPQTFVGLQSPAHPHVPATTTCPQTFVGPTVPATTTCPQTFVGPTVPSGPPLTVNTTGPQTFVGPAVPATTTCPQTFVGPTVPATTTCPQTFVGPTVPSGPPLTVNTTGPQTFVGPTVPATTTGQQTFVGPTVPATTTCPQTFVGPTVPATTTVLKSTRALPGHTTSAVVASTSTVISVLRCTSSSTFLPGTRGPPAQRVSGVKEGNNITPKTGRPGIPALCQHNGGPPDANTDENLIVSMMAALCISNRPRNPGGLPVSKATGATGNSTIPAVTGQNSGPPFLQSTQNPPKPQHWWCHGGHHHAS
ncbi:unnamed protein product [Nyctereutes procyonoides]|uniref:(raccoon dog) hypothetical protein n=1 Tax=Nyctereutes procyonoides TaxID=34880 RepID=A0A811ZGW9_NYCPR|nr:unnamed protein product [Nyctereutes procyonoides]